MEWQVSASIIGALIAILGVVAQAIKSAEEKGRVKERQDEVERDVKGAFDKIRTVEESVSGRIETVEITASQRAKQLEERQNKQESDAAEIRATLHSVDQKVDYTNSKLDELMRYHRRASGSD